MTRHDKRIFCMNTYVDSIHRVAKQVIVHEEMCAKLGLVEARLSEVVRIHALNLQDTLKEVRIVRGVEVITYDINHERERIERLIAKNRRDFDFLGAAISDGGEIL